MSTLSIVRTEVVNVGMGWGEGPVVYSGIVFPDIPTDVMHLWRDGAVSVFPHPTAGQPDGFARSAR